MSFASRDLAVHLVPGMERPGLFACNLCNSSPGVPKPACPPPSKPQCQPPSAKPPKKRSADLEALDLAQLRGQLRESLRELR